MALSESDVISDFNLDFLVENVQVDEPPITKDYTLPRNIDNNNIGIQQISAIEAARLKKSIRGLKQKICMTSEVVGRYRLVSSELVTAKEESKQICIENRHLMEKILSHEKEIDNLKQQHRLIQEENKKLLEHYDMIEKKHEGNIFQMSQLRTLVAEYETNKVSQEKNSNLMLSCMNKQKRQTIQFLRSIINMKNKNISFEMLTQKCTKFMETLKKMSCNVDIDSKTDNNSDDADDKSTTSLRTQLQQLLEEKNLLTKKSKKKICSLETLITESTIKIADLQREKDDLSSELHDLKKDTLKFIHTLRLMNHNVTPEAIAKQCNKFNSRQKLTSFTKDIISTEDEEDSDHDHAMDGNYLDSDHEISFEHIVPETEKIATKVNLNCITEMCFDDLVNVPHQHADAFQDTDHDTEPLEYNMLSTDLNNYTEDITGPTQIIDNKPQSGSDVNLSLSKFYSTKVEELTQEPNSVAKSEIEQTLNMLAARELEEAGFDNDSSFVEVYVIVPSDDEASEESLPLAISPKQPKPLSQYDNFCTVSVPDIGLDTDTDTGCGSSVPSSAYNSPVGVDVNDDTPRVPNMVSIATSPIRFPTIPVILVDKATTTDTSTTTGSSATTTDTSGSKCFGKEINKKSNEESSCNVDMDTIDVEVQNILKNRHNFMLAFDMITPLPSTPMKLNDKPKTIEETIIESRSDKEGTRKRGLGKRVKSKKIIGKQVTKKQRLGNRVKIRKCPSDLFDDHDDESMTIGSDVCDDDEITCIDTQAVVANNAKNNDTTSNNNKRSEDTDKNSKIRDTNKVITQGPAEPKRKLTKLQKLKVKLIPKSKIRTSTPPPHRQRRSKNSKEVKKQCIIARQENISSDLNKPDVYEKALKVVAELRAKEKENTRTEFKSRSSLKNSTSQSEGIPPTTTNDKIISPEKMAQEENQPLVCVTRLPKCVLNESSQSAIASALPQCVLVKSPRNTQRVISKDGLINKENSASPKRLRKLRSRIESNSDDNDSGSPKPAIVRRRLRSSGSHSSVEINKGHIAPLERLSERELSSSHCNNSGYSERRLSLRSSHSIENDSNVEVSMIRSTRSSTEFRQYSTDKIEVHIRCPQKRLPSRSPERDTKRLLRTRSSPQQLVSDKDFDESMEMNLPDEQTTNNNEDQCVTRSKTKQLQTVVYDDLDMFANNNKEDTARNVKNTERSPRASATDFKIGYFCKMIEKYGDVSYKKISVTKEKPINNLVNKLEESIERIIKLKDALLTDAMKVLADELSATKVKVLLSALITYLSSKKRQSNVLCQRYAPLAPSMTKEEQVVLYVLLQLNVKWPQEDVINALLANIEYTLFRLNHTPEFFQVENLARFYAVLCKRTRAKNRLRMFMLDAMYCISYKAIPLIKQCLEVWTHALPLGHLNSAKDPLVTCLVYLLHYYRCEDKFNRVQALRYMLQKSYSYDIYEWNETTLLEFFKNSIKDIKDNPFDKKVLRMCLIIIAKRHGTSWCEKNIVSNILLPAVKDEQLSQRVRQFCVSLLGPVMRPYPPNMKIKCDIVTNHLLHMLKDNCSGKMQEAIVTSLIYLSRHCPVKVSQTLMSWEPQEPVSPHLEELFKDYVRQKPVKAWLQLLAHQQEH